MYSRNSKIKAAFLLFVFAMNAMVSFACSASGIFHRLHHHSTPATAEHEHAGIKHQHEHTGGHHEESKSNDQQKDDCCSNSGMSVQNMDKSPSRSIEAPGGAFVTAFLVTYLFISPQTIQENTFFPDRFRWRLPTTIQDLRIVIQSFQI